MRSRPVLAPIALFTYNRPDHTRMTLEQLMRARLADQSSLYIFADGPKPNADEATLELIRAGRRLIREKQWCGKVTIIEKDVNSGIDNSIINGVNYLLKDHDRVIVMENDLVVSPGFLEYMNDALEVYKDEEKVMHISGYLIPHTNELPETFFINRYVSSWGWATWRRAWKHFNPDAAYLLKEISRSKESIRKFNFDGGYDYITMLKNCAEQDDKPWDIRWQAVVHLMDGYNLLPSKSLVQNIGHDGTGVHCGETDIYLHKDLAESIKVVKQPVVESKKGRKTIKKHYDDNKATLLNKVKYKLRKTFNLLRDTESIIVNAAPIALFVYNRPYHTRQILNSLKRCKLSDVSMLYVYCDGPREGADEETLAAIKEVREIVRSANWCKDLIIIESDKNSGVADSIIRGVTEVINRHGKIIVLEDDLVLHEDFLTYMNMALNKYANEPKVYSVTGYQFPVRFPAEVNNCFFFEDIASWSWGSWKRAWDKFDPAATGWENMKTDESMRRKFNFEDTAPYYEMLVKQMETHEVDSWAIRWYWTVFRWGGFNLYPKYSLVRNIGFDGSGIHGADSKVNLSELYDGHFIPSFPKQVKADPVARRTILKFWSLQDRYDLLSRIKKKVRKYFI